MDLLKDCDSYFKRSFDRRVVDALGETGKKIRPYGLNYSVYSSGDFNFQRILFNLSALKSSNVNRVVMSLCRLSPFISLILSKIMTNGNFNCYQSRFEDYPRSEQTPRVIFYTRLWNPLNASSQIRAERYLMNEFRVQIVKKLRKEFGTAFIGGIEPSEFALKYFPEMVVNKMETKKANYITALRNSPICITTIGLLKSNGWKLGEYVAGAKAIVTEKPFYEVPGDFSEGENYLSFNSPDECVEKVAFLMNNHMVRNQLMVNNFKYYHSYLRPDILIWNTIQESLLMNSNFKDQT